tara:strand:- start:10581 stop:11717 length:1137 start_codon:yes stop_codon:yes gene_type:complete
MVNYDEFGPQKILEVYNPRVGMRGFVVIDSLALGPAKGGIRMTPTVTREEVARLARAMTWKNALADLPFGGGKSGIIANPKEITKEKKFEIIKAFSKAIKSICPEEYIAAPDMNMAEEEVKAFVEANGEHHSATGKPTTMCLKPGKHCGIPHEFGSTGFGVFHAGRVAAEHMNLDIQGATIAIEGFGNVGEFAAKYFTEAGAKLVAVSDSRGVLYNEEGIDFEKMKETKHKEKTVTNYKPGKVLPSKEIIGIKVDILVTAAIPDLIKMSDINKIKAELIVEGSNIPMTAEIEEKLYKKGILIVPDFVANAGGVISSYAEHLGQTPEEMFKLVEKKITKNTQVILNHAKEKKIKPRDAGMEIAIERVRSKCKVCKIPEN